MKLRGRKWADEDIYQEVDGIGASKLHQKNIALITFEPWR